MVDRQRTGGYSLGTLQRKRNKNIGVEKKKVKKNWKATMGRAILDKFIMQYCKRYVE